MEIFTCIEEKKWTSAKLLKEEAKIGKKLYRDNGG